MTRRQRQRRERSTGLAVVVLAVAAVVWIRPHDYYPEAAATPAPAIESIEPTRAPTTARPTAIPRRTKPQPAATIDASCIDTNDPDAIQGAIDDGRLGLDAWDDPDNIEEAC